MKTNIDSRRAFTFVEAVIVTLIACVIMIAIQALFSHAIRSTVKGTDNLDSIRAASRLFSTLRADLIQLKSFSTNGAVSTIELSENEIPATATFSSILQISTSIATITYSLVGTPGRQSVERAVQKISSPVEKKKFGVPRMRSFEIMYVRIKNQIGSTPKETGQLLVNIVIQSENKNLPSKIVKLSSIFFPERLTESDWNYLDL